MEYICNVEGFGGLLSGLLSCVEVDEMTCFREVFANRRELKSLPGAVKIGYDGSYLSAQGHGDLPVCRMVGLADICPIVVKPKH